MLKDSYLNINTDEEEKVNAKESTDTFGVVTNCSKLNIRKQPSIDSEVIGVLNRSSEVKVYIDESTYDFYKICTSAGVDGFCMQKFVEVNK